jgi:hypothetical protein
MYTKFRREEPDGAKKFNGVDVKNRHQERLLRREEQEMSHCSAHYITK